MTTTTTKRIQTITLPALGRHYISRDGIEQALLDAMRPFGSLDTIEAGAAHDSRRRAIASAMVDVVSASSPVDRGRAIGDLLALVEHEPTSDMDHRCEVRTAAGSVALVTPSSGTEIRLSRSTTHGMRVTVDFGPRGSRSRVWDITRPLGSGPWSIWYDAGGRQVVPWDFDDSDGGDLGTPSDYPLPDDPGGYAPDHWVTSRARSSALLRLDRAEVEHMAAYEAAVEIGAIAQPGPPPGWEQRALERLGLAPQTEP